MKESLHNAMEELKRVEHLIFVSLKYTRTVDVLMNAISRMIDAYDAMIESLLKVAVEKKKIYDLPDTPIERAHQVKDLYPEDKVLDNMELYLLLRKIMKSNPQRENEYRRHVALITYIAGRQEIINIDIITEYFAFVHDFYNYVKDKVNEAE